jgi:hypothetical protein
MRIAMSAALPLRWAWRWPQAAAARLALNPGSAKSSRGRKWRSTPSRSTRRSTITSTSARTVSEIRSRRAGASLVTASNTPYVLARQDRGTLLLSDGAIASQNAKDPLCYPTLDYGAS